MFAHLRPGSIQQGVSSASHSIRAPAMDSRACQSKSGGVANQYVPARAATFAVAAAIVLPFVDTIVKTLVTDYSITMVAWVRMGLISLFLGGIGAASVGPAILRPNSLKLQVMRGLAAVLGTSMVFLGFRFMPLAECTAIVFIAPVIANAMSQFWLKERGDFTTWGIALGSFIGVLFIVKPGTDLFTPVAIYPLVGAFGLAAFLTLSRAVAATDRTAVTAFFGPFVAFLVFSLALPMFWVTPNSWNDLGLFLGMGFLAALGTYLQTLSYRYGSTHVVAPFGYLSIVVAGFLGWAFFDAVPDTWSALGMIIIATAGVLMVSGSRKP